MTNRGSWVFGLASCTLLWILGACAPQPGPPATSASTVAISTLDALEVHLSRSSGLYWPTFLVSSDKGYLWGEGNLVYRIDTTDVPTLPKPIHWPFIQGHDRLIAAAESSTGRLALLDSAGNVTVHDPMTSNTWKFSSNLQNRPAGLAVTDGVVYILQQAEQEATASAVVAFDVEGHVEGEWGEMTPDVMIQSSLQGGGITSCPDGTIFYSYINSPRIFRLSTTGAGKLDLLGNPDASFQTLDSRKIRRAYEESDREGSVGPLVKLGLGASRVMNLFCSTSGLLFRQVAQPKGAGAMIEVWEPESGDLLGKIDIESAVLLAVENETLILGTRVEDRGVLLERVQYTLDRPIGARS